MTFVKLILISLSLHFWHTVLIDFCFPNEEKWMVQAVQTSAVFLNHFWGNLILRLVVCVLGGFMQHADLIYHYMAMASMAMKKKFAPAVCLTTCKCYKFSVTLDLIK